MFYKVVLCDFDSGIINHGYDKSSGSWHNWCIFRHSNQPYLYRQFTPMENRKRGEPALYRGSSLLSEKLVVYPEDLSSYPINRDPQFHVVKGVLRKDHYLHVVTTDNIHHVPLNVECSDYLKCIDCASDPDCMWDKNNRTCVKYTEDSYNEDKFIQDVLDRGFQCFTNIPPDNAVNVTKGKEILQCYNADFWQGKIIWEDGTEEITKENKYFRIDNDFLYILHNTDHSLNISCYGVKDDHDKLYGAQEYHWILNKAPHECVLLNVFMINIKLTNISGDITEGKTTLQFNNNVTNIPGSLTEGKTTLQFNNNDSQRRYYFYQLFLLFSVIMNVIFIIVGLACFMRKKLLQRKKKKSAIVVKTNITLLNEVCITQNDD